MAKETISRSEYLQALGVFTATRRYVVFTERLIRELGEILGDPKDAAGWIGDRVWRNESEVERELEDLLADMKITVEPEAQQ